MENMLQQCFLYRVLLVLQSSLPSITYCTEGGEGGREGGRECGWDDTKRWTKDPYTADRLYNKLVYGMVHT